MCIRDRMLHRRLQDASKDASKMPLCLRFLVLDQMLQVWLASVGRGVERALRGVPPVNGGLSVMEMGILRLS